MNRVKRMLFPIICCLALAGCVKPVDCNTVGQLVVGSSTIQDANALLGAPTSTSPGESGTSIFKWEARTHVTTGGGTSTVVQLSFGKDGKLLSKGCTTVVIPPLVREPAA